MAFDKATKAAPVAVSVGVTATLLLAANGNRWTAMLANEGAAKCFLGRDDTVTAATGIPLAAGASLDDPDTRDAWWGITASGTADVRVLESVLP